MILAAELRAALAQRCVAGAALCLVVAASLLAPASPGPVWWLALAALPWILALVWPPETPWRPAFAAWTAWIAWGGVCALASREPWLSLAGWWRQASVFGTLVLAAAWWSRRERRWWGMGFTTLALAGTAALAARPGATAPTWGAAAELWAPIGAAVAAGWLSGGEREGVRRFLWAALLIGAAGVGWAGSWPARIALATCALLCLAFASRRAAGAALLLAVGAATAAARANGAAWHPAPFWSDALAVLSAHPVTGVGPRLLERELARLHGAPLPAGGSLLLRVGAESGWPGLVLFAAAALGSVPRGFRRFDGPGRAAAALLAALAAYAVVGDPSGSPGFFVALATAAAVALSPARSGSVRASEEGAPMRLQRWFPALGLALALGSAVPGWLLSRSLARAAAAPSADGRLEALQEASRLAPDDGAIHARIAREAMAAKPPRVGLAALEIQKACEAEPAQAAYRAQWAELRGASR